MCEHAPCNTSVGSGSIFPGDVFTPTIRVSDELQFDKLRFNYIKVPALIMLKILRRFFMIQKMLVIFPN